MFFLGLGTFSVRWRQEEIMSKQALWLMEAKWSLSKDSFSRMTTILNELESDSRNWLREWWIGNQSQSSGKFKPTVRLSEHCHDSENTFAVLSSLPLIWLSAIPFLFLQSLFLDCYSRTATRDWTCVTCELSSQLRFRMPPSLFPLIIPAWSDSLFFGLFFPPFFPRHRFPLSRREDRSSRKIFYPSSFFFLS